MKAIKLIVKNIGIVADATIELNKPLIALYGEIKQGKTTILNGRQGNQEERHLCDSGHWPPG